MNTEELTAKVVQLQHELEQAQKAALESTEARDAFLSRISHELRTPLNAIMGMVELMADSGLDEVQDTYLSMINQSAGQLLQLVNEVLDFSQLQAGPVEEASQDFHVPTDVVPRLHPLVSKAREKGLHFAIHVDKGLNAPVHGPPSWIVQVVTAVVDNAIKFTDYGEIHVQLFLNAGRRKGSSLCIAVTDTGIGIPKTSQESIFQKFVTGPHSERYGGIGVGLTMASELVEKMGGKIWVDSELYLGSTFYISLPLSKVAADKASATAKMGPFKILLAEDEPVNQFMTTQLLANQGHIVAAVDNGRQALAELSRGNYDLVLMDVSMPEMDGLEAARIIRSGSISSIDRDIPIVALTAMVMPADRQRCFAAGMNAYVSKPVETNRLEQIMREVISEKA